MGLCILLPGNASVFDAHQDGSRMQRAVRPGIGFRGTVTRKKNRPQAAGGRMRSDLVPESARAQNVLPTKGATSACGTWQSTQV